MIRILLKIPIIYLIFNNNKQFFRVEKGKLPYGLKNKNIRKIRDIPVMYQR